MEEQFKTPPEEKFIEDKLKLYYEINFGAPIDLERREFGFGFQKKIDIRHKAFQSARELNNFILLNVPRFISYSTGKYAFPAARPIERKELIKADLVFDLDTSPRNKGHKHGEKTVYCLECVENVRNDTIRMKEEFLEKEFGFRKEEMFQKFSGSKGFHIHVLSEAAAQLQSSARRQLAAYISGSELNSNTMLKKVEFENKKFAFKGPNANSKGWLGRIHAEMRRTIATKNPESMAKMGIPKKEAQIISQNPLHYLNEIDNGNWSFFSKPGKTIEKFIDKKRLENGIEVDAPVTFDMHRLIRLENSIHGESGLVAKKLEDSIFPTFNPLIHATPFKRGEVTIMPLQEIEIELSQTIELKREIKAEVPTSLALMLFCKKKAKLC